MIPRTFAPAPGWSPGGHRIKAPLEYSRGREKTRVYGALRPADGREVALCAPSRNTAGWLRLLQEIARANPRGRLYVIADSLSSHTSGPVRRWLRKHPRVHQVFIPVGACWLNLAEGWWRLLRKAALAGQTFADPGEIACAVRVATAQLNTRARPWVWGRPPPPHRRLRRKFAYLL
ncbi:MULTISPECIES: transposase [unclassified Streptomyces]|uniref:transposase n=1 Tax=unclassified Streptomyces TaxID=2593676 RepID=UPI003D8A99C3